MRISIVTPSLDSERFLDLALGSIWDQQTSRFELEHILADGGSTDATLDIASDYPSRVISGPDRGMYDAINKGLAIATGDVFGYLNSDDEFEPRALDVVAKAFEEHELASWLIAPTVFVDAEGKKVAVFRPPRPIDARRLRALGWSAIPQPSTFFRMDLIRELGGFDADFRMAGDYDLYVRALEIARPIYVRVPLARFRLHGENLSKATEQLEAEARLISRQEPGAMARWLRFVTRLQVNGINPGWAFSKISGRFPQ